MRRYQNIPLVKGTNNKQVTRFVLYPEIPFALEDIYVVTTSGDRLDTLADIYYGDVTLAWIIATANNLGAEGYIITPGLTLRIPARVNEIITEFENINRLQS